MIKEELVLKPEIPGKFNIQDPFLNKNNKNTSSKLF